MNSHKTLLVLLLIVLVGFYLRVANLGYLGFNGDEDITSLAVKGILDHGYPLFPSGMIYLRSVPFLYSLALSVKIFGFTEFALRIPAAIFSAGLIVLAYFFVTHLFGKRMGLAVAAIVAVSPWEVETGRIARQYAPFAFFYLLTLFSFYRHYIEEKGRWKFLTTVLAIITCTIHELGITLALLFLFPLVLNGYRSMRAVRLISSFILVAITSYTWLRLELYYQYIPVRIHADPRLLLDAQQTSTSISTQTLGPFQLPSFALLADVYHNAFPVFLMLTLASVGLVGILLRWGISQKRMGESLILSLVVVFLYLQQFTVVLILLILLCFRMKEGLAAFRQPKVIGLALGIGVALSLWLLYGLTLWEGNEYVWLGKSSQFRQTIGALIDFPRLHIREFINEMPVMTGLAGIGSLWCFHVGSRNSALKPLFILYAFTVPLLVHGLAPSGSSLRYNFQLHVLFIVLAVLGVTKWHEIADGLLPDNLARSLSQRIGLVPHRLMGGFITGSLFLAAVSIDVNPLKSFLVTERAYHHEGTRKKLFERWGFEYYPDHKTTAEYVRKNLRESDLIVVMDWLEQYNYIGRTDYWIRTDAYIHQTYLQEGRLRDLYTGAFVIGDLEQLKQVISDNQGRRIWIVTSSLEIREMAKVSEEIVTFLNSLSEEVVYVGKDQESKVYLLESSRQEQQNLSKSLVALLFPTSYDLRRDSSRHSKDPRYVTKGWWRAFPKELFGRIAQAT